MKGLVIVGDYFEDTELIATIDVLKRHNDEVDIVSMMGRKDLISKCGLKITLEKTIEEVDLETYDFLFIPGGPGSFKILAFIPKVNQIIEHFVKNDKLVASICAAPMLVGRLGYFKDRNYTVFPGFEKDIIGGNYLKEQGVVTDGKFITGHSMYYSIDLGLEIVKFYYGEEEKNKLELSLKAIN